MKLNLLILCFFLIISTTIHFDNPDIKSLNQKSSYFRLNGLPIKKQVVMLFTPLANEALKRWRSIDHVSSTFGLSKSANFVEVII